MSIRFYGHTLYFRKTGSDSFGCPLFLAGTAWAGDIHFVPPFRNAVSDSSEEMSKRQYIVVYSAVHGAKEMCIRDRSLYIPVGVNYGQQLREPRQ